MPTQTRSFRAGRRESGPAGHWAAIDVKASRHGTRETALAETLKYLKGEFAFIRCKGAYRTTRRGLRHTTKLSGKLVIDSIS
jgi:hypothetical protein